MADIRSDFEAEVNEIPFHNGALVKAGDTVITLSVCKMLSGIAAPVDGIITYACNVGDYVGLGQTLARIEE